MNMALTEEQEHLEHTARITLMNADTELKEAQRRKSEQDWRLDPQRVIVQAVLATAAIVGAFASVAGYFVGRGHS
jgi:hypothetical protein